MEWRYLVPYTSPVVCQPSLPVTCSVCGVRSLKLTHPSSFTAHKQLPIGEPSCSGSIFLWEQRLEKRRPLQVLKEGNVKRKCWSLCGLQSWGLAQGEAAGFAYDVFVSWKACNEGRVKPDLPTHRLQTDTVRALVFCSLKSAFCFWSLRGSLHLYRNHTLWLPLPLRTSAPTPFKYGVLAKCYLTLEALRTLGVHLFIESFVHLFGLLS